MYLVIKLDCLLCIYERVRNVLNYYKLLYSSPQYLKKKVLKKNRCLANKTTTYKLGNIIWENCHITSYSSLVRRLNRPDRKKRLKYLQNYCNLHSTELNVTLFTCWLVSKKSNDLFTTCGK